jgi:hypothetical protein
VGLGAPETRFGRQQPEQTFRVFDQPRPTNNGFGDEVEINVKKNN